MSQFNFDINNSFEKRKDEFEKINTKYPNRIPVIVEKVKTSKLQDIDKSKFLVPKDLTVGQLLYVIRRRIHLPPEKAIFMFVNKILPASSQLLSNIYHKHKSSDGFLKIEFSDENTFG